MRNLCMMCSLEIESLHYSCLRIGCIFAKLVEVFQQCRREPDSTREDASFVQDGARRKPSPVADGALTRNAAIGTPSYMASEQGQEQAEHPTDLFAVATSMNGGSP